MGAVTSAVRPPAHAPHESLERRLHLGWQLAARAVASVALRPLMRSACRLEGRACARDFFARGYRHHIRGADTPPCCRARIFEVLREVSEALTAAHVPWFAFWGTFLGAVRHGSLIPWDRDADLVVLESDRERALAALAPLTEARRDGPARALRRTGTGASEVVRVQASATNQVGVDVEFWREQGNALVHGEGLSEVRLCRADIYPWVTRRFGPFWLPTPWSLAPLHALYGPDCLEQGFRCDQRFGDPWVDLARCAVHATGRSARAVRGVMDPGGS
jgi:hypothetical protein